MQPRPILTTQPDLIKTTTISSPQKAELFFDIKRNSLDDGPGIRSVVFFKGCPLSCTWCQNPESIATKHELSFNVGKCINCNDCVSVCPEQAISKDVEGRIDRDKCTLCYKCVEVCPSGALEIVGRKTEIDDLAAEVVQDQPFFEESGGGVTVSGGEAMMQMETVSALFIRLKEKGVHTLIQTAGLFKYRIFEKKVLPYTDAIFFDIKLMNSEMHKEHCGVPNEVILNNYQKIQKVALESDLELLPRVPLIPGITDTNQNLIEIANFLELHQASKIQILPYNPIWLDKLPKFGGKPRLDIGEQTRTFMPQEEIDRCSSIFESRGIEVICH